MRLYKCFDHLKLYLCPLKWIILESVIYHRAVSPSSDQSVFNHVKRVHISTLIGVHQETKKNSWESTNIHEVLRYFMVQPYGLRFALNSFKKIENLD